VAVEPNAVLTPTSYVVLGLVGAAGPVTSYELKQIVASSIGNFWSFPHSQLYAEPTRLVKVGLLNEKVEPNGRRRRHYTLTTGGRRALVDWLGEPAREQSEIRDLGLLKLFFLSQADPQRRHKLALDQRASHESALRDIEALYAAVSDVADPWQRRALEVGARFQRLALDFWSEVADELKPARRR
jgi:PadR family transcriptional regulator, regulatory protein AphA